MTNVPPNIGNLRGAVDLSSLVNRPAPGQTAGATPGAPGAAGEPIPVPALVLDGTDANFGDILQISSHVPVLVDLWAEWCEPCKQLTPVLEKLVAELGGRVLMVKVDVDSNPQLAQAFQAQSIPTVAALVGGRPVPLFTGAIPEAEIREILDQLFALAGQQGVTGTASAPAAAPGEEPGAPAAPVEPELPPLHKEALDSIDRGDYASAIASYKTAIAQDPRDAMAKAALAQVSLLHRLQGKSLDQIRSAAAANPTDLDAQLDVADLDLSGGHIGDAFDRLLELFPEQDAAGKTRVRERMLELFEVVGAEAPQVALARRRLTMLLY